jgi:hypothetical protein
LPPKINIVKTKPQFVPDAERLYLPRFQQPIDLVPTDPQIVGRFRDGQYRWHRFILSGQKNDPSILGIFGPIGYVSESIFAGT